MHVLYRGVRENIPQSFSTIAIASRRDANSVCSSSVSVSLSTNGNRAASMSARIFSIVTHPPSDRVAGGLFISSTPDGYATGCAFNFTTNSPYRTAGARLPSVRTAPPSHDARRGMPMLLSRCVRVFCARCIARSK